MNIEGISPEDVQRMTEAVLAIAPEMQGVMDDLRQRAKSEGELGVLLWRWCEEHPEVVERLTAKFLAPQSPTEILVPDAHPKAEPVQSPLPAILVQERAQFDGDVPEYRDGPLVGNAMPAIPVETTSRNPVQIGMMLEAVSQQVKEEANRLTAEWQSLVEGTTGTDMVVSDKPPEPAGYQSGKPAEMTTAEEVAPTALLALSAEQRQRYSWKMISTTQGRRSALAQVAQVVSERLKEAGFECPVREVLPTRRVAILAHSGWKYTLTGKEELQPQFSFVDVAAKTIAEGLKANAANGWLEAVPIDTVDVRMVGWACRIVKDT